MSSPLSRLLGPVAAAAVLVVTLSLVEGLSSLALVARDLASGDEGRYSRYDASLGWMPIPGIHLPDRFGPGRYVRTNARGFRNDQEIDAAAPPGKVRLLCSGDSFAFGEGVANDRAWCHLLEALHPRLETANLAFPGYGIDQAYLRYLREGEEVEHAIHLFAFIEGDVHRMGRTEQHGYGKPILRRSGEQLVVDNVPVPRLGPWLSRKLRRAGEELRAVRLGGALWARLGPAGDGHDDYWTVEEETYAVAERVFQTLQERSEARRVALAFVYLPTPREIGEVVPVYPWVQAVMAKHGFDLVDLKRDLDQVPEDLASTFFIPPGREAEGHYSERGNEWVAARLWEHLQAIPRARARLESGADDAAAHRGLESR